MAGRCFGRDGTRLLMSIRAGAAPQAVGARDAAPPIAERSELRGELRRVVYGGAESVRDESGGLLDERQRLGRRKEAGSPRGENGEIERHSDEGVPVVADLKRFDAQGALSVSSGDGGRVLDKPPRQDFHPERRNQNDRHNHPQGGARPTTECTAPPGEIFHSGLINTDGEPTCQDLPLPSRVRPRRRPFPRA